MPLPPAPNPIDDLLVEFRRYLLDERAIAPTSAVSYVHIARLFLTEHVTRLDCLTAADVTPFVAEQCALCGASYVVCGLRSFLRWCHLRDLTPGPLAGAVPAAASRRLASLPQSLSPGDVRKLLESCDRRTTFGRRDFAVLTVLARLGLRAGEVAALELADIDWRAGEMVVRGKGPRIDRLPLPFDVGKAVAAWLRRGRGECPCPNLFTRVRAPRIALTSSGISNLVSSACRRAGLPEVSAHRLRHTAATEMLRSGSSLTEVGQVLRHRSLLTTGIYAKVDHISLSEVAQPWPGGAT
jgi:integrase